MKHWDFVCFHGVIEDLSIWVQTLSHYSTSGC